MKDVINRGGEKIPVAEIEQLLHTHPAVRDVAIVAMPNGLVGLLRSLRYPAGRRWIK